MAQLRTRWVQTVTMLTLLVAAVGCDDAKTSRDATSSLDGGGTTPDATTDGATAGTSDSTSNATSDAQTKPASAAKNVSDLSYEFKGLWATPLADYHEAATKAAEGKPFSQAIRDLVPFDHKLFIGYGDASLQSAGGPPVAMRAFTDPESAKTTDEFTSSDGQISRFRRIDAELWVSGESPVEGGLLGNLYRRKVAGKWLKQRTVQSALHVHDVARHDGALWAVGSGATAKQRQAGDVYAHLWHSADDGATVQSVSQSWNHGVGDARFVELLPTSAGLLAFGYKVNEKSKLTELPHVVVARTKSGDWTEEPLAPTHPLKSVMVLGCWPTGQGAGVVTGVDILKKPQKLEAWLVAGDGATPLGLAGNAVVDVHVEGDEVVVLGRAGDAWPSTKQGNTWQVRVWRSSNLKNWTKLLDFQSGDDVTAIAWWRGDLYIGSEFGQVWRATGAWPR